MKKRIVFFGDNNSYISSILFKSFKENLLENFELVAVINTTKKIKNRKIRNITNYSIKKIFNPLSSFSVDLYNSFLDDVPYNVKIYNCLNINDPKFIKKLKEINADFAFIIGCPQILKLELINTFEKCINYHNSFLPEYRGLAATKWSMYNEEEFTGYTFHYINEKIDDGKIIFQEKVKINYLLDPFENEVNKTNYASKNLIKVFKLLNDNFNGISQNGKVSYFGDNEKYKLLNFTYDKNIEKANKLIHIWGGINMNYKNEVVFVTKVTDSLEIKRIKWLPVIVYNIYKKVRNIKDLVKSKIH